MRSHLPPLRRLAALAAVLALVWSLEGRAEDAAGSTTQVPPPPASPGQPANAAAQPPPAGEQQASPPPSAQRPGEAASGPAAPAPAAPPAEPEEKPAPEQPKIPPPVVPVPEVEQRPPRPDDVFSGHPVPPTEQREGQEHSWFDAGHAFVGRVFFAPVVRLDRFFSDETDLDPERAQSFARLRGGIKLRQDGKPIWSNDLLAQLYLPGVEKWLDRFRLVLSGASDTTEDPLTADTASTAPLARRRIDPANLELRFGAYRGIRNSIDLGAGILFRFPPGAFTRARYRLAVPIDDIMVARLSYQVFWRTDMLLGTRLTSAVEWPVTPSSMLRLGGTSQVAQRKTNGIEYGAELVYSHAFSSTAAVALGTDAVGASRIPVAFDRYRVFARFRHDVLRRWVFMELEPEVAWPWTRDRGRYRAYGVTFRLELQFEGRGAVAANP